MRLPVSEVDSDDQQALVTPEQFPNHLEQRIIVLRRKSRITSPLFSKRSRPPFLANCRYSVVQSV